MASKSDVKSKIAVMHPREIVKAKCSLFKDERNISEREKSGETDKQASSVTANGSSKFSPKIKIEGVTGSKIPTKQAVVSRTFGYKAQSRIVIEQQSLISEKNSNDIAASKENCDKNVELGKPNFVLKQRQLKPPSYSLKTTSNELAKILQREMSLQSPNTSVTSSNLRHEIVSDSDCSKEEYTNVDGKVSNGVHSEGIFHSECLTSPRTTSGASLEIPAVTIQMLSPRKCGTHAGLLFNPNPSKTTTTKPFNFDHKTKNKRRYKTAPNQESPTASRQKSSVVAVDDSKLVAAKKMENNESKIRDIKKSEVKILMENQSSSDRKKVIGKETAISTKGGLTVSHGGLTFHPKPVLTKSNTFTIKPGESKILEELQRRNSQLMGKTQTENEL